MTTTQCGMCHCSDCDQCFPPMTVDEFLTRLDERKRAEQTVKQNPVLTVTTLLALQARLDEAEQLLRDVVDGEEGDYPIAAIRAFLGGTNG